MSERDNSQYEKLEKLAEQYKRWDYSSEKQPRISKESVEKFAPTNLANQHKNNGPTKDKEPTKKSPDPMIIESRTTEHHVEKDKKVQAGESKHKNIFDKLSTLGCMIPVILGGLIPIALMFVGVWKLAEGNIGLFFLNLLLLPLALVGVINVFRGICAVLEKDQEKFGRNVKNNWKFYLYIVIHFGGYFALAYVLAKYINIS